MDKTTALNELKEWEFKISAYNLLLSTAMFDESTIAPKGGLEYRSERFAYLNSILYELTTDKKIEEIIIYLSSLDDLALEDKRKVTLYLKDINKTKAIPKDEYVAFSKAQMLAGDAWEKAKKKDDYSIFKPNLLKMIDYQKRFALYRNPDKDPYDTLLDDYEEGMNKEKYDRFFKRIKEEILPLIRRITETQKIDDTFLYRFYAKDKQAKLMHDINAYLGFDKDWGYMGISMHPFTCGMSNNDVRVTTAYDEHNLSSSIYSIIHEVGHAFYEHQMAKEYDGTILKAVSSGMHESQSRLFENYLGRDKNLIANYFYKMKELFKEELKDVTLDDYYRAVNASKPSLIRTDADELTYPIHILIRYEIEKGIFDGTLDLDDLDKIWDEYYQEYLGIKADRPSLGILQDIHWSDGSFGYFPTYALGSAVAAQINAKMRKDMDVKKALSDDFKKITLYLKDHVQKYGALYPLDEILIKATDQSFDPDFYISYLKEKYTALYHLDK